MPKLRPFPTLEPDLSEKVTDTLPFDTNRTKCNKLQLRRDPQLGSTIVTRRLHVELDTMPHHRSSLRCEAASRASMILARRGGASQTLTSELASEIYDVITQLRGKKLSMSSANSHCGPTAMQVKLVPSLTSRVQELGLGREMDR